MVRERPAGRRRQGRVMVRVTNDGVRTRVEVKGRSEFKKRGAKGRLNGRVGAGRQLERGRIRWVIQRPGGVSREKGREGRGQGGVSDDVEGRKGAEGAR
jgi:hypothetical protein